MVEVEAAPAGTRHGDVEAVDGGHGAGGQSLVDAEAHRRGPPRFVAVVAEGELRDGGPDAAPSAGEDAGARGLRGGVEAEQDYVEEVVGEAADAVARRRVVLAAMDAAAAAAALLGHGGWICWSRAGGSFRCDIVILLYGLRNRKMELIEGRKTLGKKNNSDLCIPKIHTDNQ